ncbi:MAG: hypothetical protein DRJ01_03070 [Bacteroidetes bacterium]|nr:MAG: hypothetical protein DRJ01_03070 [Bacteroidota bacterium]
MKIKKKISLIFISIFLLSIIIISTFSYIIVKNIVINNAIKNLEAVSLAQKNYLTNIDGLNKERVILISSRSQLLKSLKKFIQSPQKQHQTTMNGILNDALKSIPNFTEISVINLKGIIVASTNTEKIGTKIQQNHCFLNGQKGNIDSHLFLDENKNLKIHLSGPLILYKELIGVLLITATEDKISKFFTDYSLFGKTGYPFLVIKTDKKNKFIVSSRRFNGKHTNYSYAYYKELGEISKKTINKEIGTYKTICDYKNRQMAAVVNYYNKFNIGYSVRISRNEILKPVIRYRNFLILISFSSILIILIFIIISVNSITKPIIKLTKLTKEISQGNFNQKIEISTKDEIGILSKSFNLMTDNLTKDTIKRELVEKNLRESEQKYRTIFENTGTATIIIEEDKIISLVNSKFENLTGYTSEEVEGKKYWTEFVFSEDLDRMKKQLDLRRKNNTALKSYEFRLIDKNKQIKIILLNIDIIPGTKKSVASLLDITKHKLSEKRIEHLNTVLRAIRNINKLITNVKDPKELINRACKTLVNNHSYYHAWISLFDKSKKYYISSESGMGDFYSSLKEVLKNGKLPKCINEALKKSKISIIKNPVEECPDCPLSKFYEDRAAMAMRLEYERKIYGIMSVSSPKDVVESDEERSLFKKVVEDISFALYRINLEKEREYAVEALKESEEKFRVLAQTSPMAIMVYQKDKWVYANKAAEKICEYSLSELKNMHFWEFVTPEFQDIIKNRGQAREKGQQLGTNYEFKIITKSGRIKWVYLNGSSIKINNVFSGFITVLDITERKRAEQVQTVIHNISNAVITTDNVNEFITIVKDELNEIIDTSNFYVALKNKNSDTLSLLYHNDEKDKTTSLPAGKTLSSYVIKTKKALLASQEVKNKLVESGEVELLGSSSKIWLGIPLIVKEKVIGIMAVQSYTDEKAFDNKDMAILQIISHQISISLERKKNEQNLKEALEKALESDRLKTAFLANMSHEIRTPMNGILGFVNLLNNPEISPSDKNEFTQIIRNSSKRLLDTINDIIDISKIDAGEIKISNTKTSINNLMNELYDFFLQEANNKGLQLISKPTLSEDKAFIYTDNVKLHAILTNLIKNAIKFTKQGSVTFGYFLKGEFMEFYVEDTGIGVPKNRQEAIFNRFEQADIRDSRVFEGSGLGLAIAKAYVLMLGGQIKLESEEENHEGEKPSWSKFIFTIPYRKKK